MLDQFQFTAKRQPGGDVKFSVLITETSGDVEGHRIMPALEFESAVNLPDAVASLCDDARDALLHHIAENGGEDVQA